MRWNKLMYGGKKKTLVTQILKAPQEFDMVIRPLSGCLMSKVKNGHMTQEALGQQQNGLFPVL